MRLSLLTLNAGLLRFLGDRFQPAPHVQARAEALPAALLDSGADVIALQEVYEEPHRRLLQARLAATHAHVARPPAGTAWGLENGLMVFSRHELQATSLRLFRAGMLEERLFDHKGVLAAELVLGGLPLAIFNVHTTAGGAFTHPEHRRCDRVRADQIGEVLAWVSERGATPVVVGDLNAGPGVSDANYRLLERGGFTDVHRLCNGAAAEADVTWDPRNALNARGPHRTSPPQRIDHVFLRASDVERRAMRPLSSAVVLREAQVATADGPVTVSDHYGLIVSLEVGEGG